MPIIRLLSGGVILVKPVVAVLRWARPTSMVTRALFLLLGICLVTAAVGAHQDGQDGWAARLIAIGLVLVFLRRHRPEVPSALPIQDQSPVEIPSEPEVPNQSPVEIPSGRQMCGPISEKLQAGWCRSNVAEKGDGTPTFPSSPTAVAWSLIGAMTTVDMDPPEWRRYIVCLEAVLSERYGVELRGADGLRRWAAATHRTQAEVVSVAAEAERRAGEGTERKGARKMRISRWRRLRCWFGWHHVSQSFCHYDGSQHHVRCVWCGHQCYV